MDDTLASFVVEPVAVREGTVVVAGSGKDNGVGKGLETSLERAVPGASWLADKPAHGSPIPPLARAGPAQSPQLQELLIQAAQPRSVLVLWAPSSTGLGGCR